MSERYAATSAPPAGRRTDPLSQLAPFNEARFRACLAYLSATKGRELSQLYAVKFNVLIDLFHLLACGKPVIGGSIAPWELGPVVVEAYRTCAQWRADYDQCGRAPQGFRVTGRTATGKTSFRAIEAPDPDDFSALEIEAMERAWREIGDLNFPALRHYTHDPATFLGRAYENARREHRLMDWEEVIACYDQSRDEDHSGIRELLRY